MSEPPSVDRIARSLIDSGLPFPLLVDSAREALRLGDAAVARELVEARSRQLLQPVVNATGVLLHTNLGRAPWPGSDAQPLYNNVEFDLASGRRGDRSAHAASLIARASGAESALVVNNGAAAVLLALRTLAGGSGVAVSRGELIEIGGSFRIPEILQESGVSLIEVGTTNRTRSADYESAVARGGSDVGAILKVHQSNFRLEGFVEETSVRELASIGPLVIVDLGSGLLDARCPWLNGEPPRWLSDEPAVRQTLEAGADLVTFSGDKLLGGPQAGVIAGRAELVARCARNPLARVLRPGSHILAMLQSVMLAYLDKDGQAIPLWRMATAPTELVKQRASAIADRASISSERVQPTEAVMGGGTLPGRTIPSWGLHLPVGALDVLRSQTLPIICRVNNNETVVDLRTVDPSDDEYLAKILTACAATI